MIFIWWRAGGFLFPHKHVQDFPQLLIQLTTVLSTEIVDKLLEVIGGTAARRGGGKMLLQTQRPCRLECHPWHSSRSILPPPLLAAVPPMSFYIKISRLDLNHLLPCRFSAL
jgi:hypothetical protein